MTADVLQQLTTTSRSKAEQCAFIKRITSKKITPAQYHVHLTNQHAIYRAIEDIGDQLGIFDKIGEIKRFCYLSMDLGELEGEYDFVRPELLESTNRYIEYIGTVSTDYTAIMAHVYAMYTGDMEQGQVLARYVPGSAKWYNFGSDVANLKATLNAQSKATMTNEVNKYYGYRIRYLNELEAYIS